MATWKNLQHNPSTLGIYLFNKKCCAFGTKWVPGKKKQKILNSTVKSRQPA